MESQSIPPNKKPLFETLHPKHSPVRFGLALLVVLVAAIAVLSAFAYVLSGREKATNSAVATETIRGEVATVTISESGVTPSTLQVMSGQQVTFKNEATTSHRLYADPEYLSEFDSVEALSTGSTYTYVFDTPGVYNYYDPANDTVVRGTVEVR